MQQVVYDLESSPGGDRNQIRSSHPGKQTLDRDGEKEGEGGGGGSEDREKLQVKKATGKRAAAAAARSRSEDGEQRQVKKAKVGDSSSPTVVCDVISPVNSGGIIAPAGPSCETGPSILSVDSNLAHIPVINVRITSLLSKLDAAKAKRELSVVSSLAQLPVIYVQFQHCSAEDAPNSVLFPLFSELGEKILSTCPVSIRDDFIFVLYKTRDGANKAVLDPLKKLPGGGELVCSITPQALLDSIRQTVLDKVTPLLQHHPASTRVYVCNVNSQADPDQLKALFSQFGEITAGPLLLTLDPEWEIVHYLIVYETEEGAEKALKQPDKQFGDHQLHCTADVEHVVKTAQEEVLQEIETFVGHITSRHDTAETKRQLLQQQGAEPSLIHQLLQQQGAKPSLSSAINDVMVAAGRFKTAADMAVAAAESLKSAVDLITTQLQGSGAGPTSS